MYNHLTSLHLPPGPVFLWNYIQSCNVKFFCFLGAGRDDHVQETSTLQWNPGQPAKVCGTVNCSTPWRSPEGLDLLSLRRSELLTLHLAISTCSISGRGTSMTVKHTSPLHPWAWWPQDELLEYSGFFSLDTLHSSSVSAQNTSWVSHPLPAHRWILPLSNLWFSLSPLAPETRTHLFSCLLPSISLPVPVSELDSFPGT